MYDITAVSTFYATAFCRHSRPPPPSVCVLLSVLVAAGAHKSQFRMCRTNRKRFLCVQHIYNIYIYSASNSIATPNDGAFEYLNTFRCIRTAKMKWQAVWPSSVRKMRKRTEIVCCKKTSSGKCRKYCCTFGVAVKLPRSNALRLRSFRMLRLCCGRSSNVDTAARSRKSSTLRSCGRRQSVWTVCSGYEICINFIMLAFHRWPSILFQCRRSIGAGVNRPIYLYTHIHSYIWA